MTKMKKRSYATPAIKVVAFQVELGFEPSTNVGSQSRRLNGIETFNSFNQQSDGSWAATDYNPYNEGHVFWQLRITTKELKDLS